MAEDAAVGHATDIVQEDPVAPLPPGGDDLPDAAADATNAAHQALTDDTPPVSGDAVNAANAAMNSIDPGSPLKPVTDAGTPPDVTAVTAPTDVAALPAEAAADTGNTPSNAIPAAATPTAFDFAGSAEAAGPPDAGAGNAAIAVNEASKCPDACKAPTAQAGNISTGGQPLFDETGVKVCAYRSSPLDTKGRRFCGTGAGFDENDSVDCSLCVSVQPPGPCLVQGYYYYPYYHARFPKDMEANYEGCQIRCKTDVYCKYFGYWPDGGCLLQGVWANLERSSSACSDDQKVGDTCSGKLVISGPEECSSKSYGLFPNIALAKDATPPIASSGAIGCTTIGQIWQPDLPGVTTQPTWLLCQAQCEMNPKCKHFTYKADKSCTLQGEDAEQVDGEKDVISGPRMCKETGVPGECTVTGFYYEPVGNRISVGRWEDCRELCHSSLECQKFAFWPDGGCHFQNATAKIVKATCKDGGTDCDNLKVRVGPQGCGPEYYSWYPAVEMSGSTPGTVTQPSAPGTFLPPQVHADRSNDGMSWPTILVGLLLLLALLAGALYGLGFCDEDEKKKKKKKKDKGRTRNKVNENESKALINEKPLRTTTENVVTYQPQVAQAPGVAYQAVPQQLHAVQGSERGVVMQTQTPAMEAAFAAMDRNNDGVITREEFNAARSAGVPVPLPGVRAVQSGGMSPPASTVAYNSQTGGVYVQSGR